MRLTPSFTLAEFATSASHADLVRPVPAELQSYVRLLCLLGLEPLRQAMGYPLRVLSGYRSVELNKAVGGSPTSQHAVAQAADVTSAAGAERMFRWLLRVQPVGIGQVIYYPAQQFVHVALVSAQHPTFRGFVSRQPKQYTVVPNERELDALLGTPAVVTV